MKARISPLLIIAILCLASLIGGCGRDSVNVTTITRVVVNGIEEATLLKDVQLPVVEDFRKNLRSGIGVKIVNAKAVGYVFGGFMEERMILFDSTIEIHGQKHPAKILIDIYSISHGKNTTGPFVNIPQSGDSMQAICINGIYYGPLANLGLD